MTPPDPAIFFLSDYGTADEFVGVVHAVLHRLAPHVRVIDLSHQIAPFDVAGGAAMLVRCAPHLGPGVALAVVDPGVGTDRRSVAIRTVDDHAGLGGPSWLVGPDNGLLMPMAAACGGVDSAVAIDRDGAVASHRRTLPPEAGEPGPTFDGRDVFAPAAARLALGADPGLLGTRIDPASLVVGAAGPRVGDGGGPRPPGPGFLTSVASIDRFGNVQLEAGTGALADVSIPPGGTFRVTVVTGTSGRPTGTAGDPSGVPEGPFPGRRVAAFAELEQGELGLLVDGTGHLALVLDRAPASARLHPIGVGSRVLIAPGTADPDGP
ncbi:MAG: SAM-dependent chlorinase/fluorinase [Acidimicrobiales bacterium]